MNEEVAKTQYVYQIQYLFIREQGEDRRVVEYVLANSHDAVWKYYRDSIAQDNIEFVSISKLFPIIRCL